MSAAPLPARPDAFVLAGGRSRRMGRNKALLELDGATLLGHVVRAAAQVAGRVALIADDATPYATLGLEAFPDRWPGAGALGGIGTALTHSRTPQTLVLACDIPLVSSALLALLVARGAAGADVVLPRTDARGPHPLSALYSGRCLEPIARSIAAGELKVTRFFREVEVIELDEAELGRAGISSAELANLNTPEEYAEAAAELARRAPAGPSERP